MIEDFRRLLGKSAAWELGPADEVAREIGAGVSVAVRPKDAAECAAALAKAAELHLRVVPWGGGQHQRLGNLCEPADVLLVTQAMAGIADLDAVDQTATVRAGTRLADLATELAAHGLFLPVEPSGFARATLGGAVAAGVNGPLRTGYGLPVKHLLGTVTAHVDGKVARAGGRLVKNVTGFDLHRLYHGSLGTLAVLCDLHVRLSPVPARSATLAAAFDELEPLDRFVAAARAHVLRPAAFSVVDGATLRAIGGPAELSGDAGRFVALLAFHGGERTVVRALRACIGLLAELDPAVVSELEGTAASALWQAVRDAVPRLDPDGQGAVLKVAYLPFSEGASALAPLVESLVALAAGDDLPASVLAEPELGILRVALPRPPSGALLRALSRLPVGNRGPRAIVESAPPAWRQNRDVYLGHLEHAELQERVKRAFDPANLLAPGRLSAAFPAGAGAPP